MYLKWCVVLDCYKQKLFTKRRNMKLFTRRYITVHSQFQTRHSPVVTQQLTESWRTCWFNVAYLRFLSRIHWLVLFVCLFCLEQNKLWLSNCGLSYLIKSTHVISSAVILTKKFLFLHSEKQKYIYTLYGDLFNTATYTAVCFSHHQLAYWSIERQKARHISSQRVGANLLLLFTNSRQTIYTIIKTSRKPT